MPEAPRYNVELDSSISVCTEPEVDVLVDMPSLIGRGEHSGTMQCPITGTLFLRPRQYEAGYTITPLALTATDPDNWEPVAVGASGNIFQLSQNASTGYVASASQSANAPFMVSFFCYGSAALGVYNVANIEFGGFTLNINSDGLCGIGNTKGYLSGYGPQGQGRFSLNNRWVRLLILPMNRRDILIYADDGGAWVYRRTDLDIATAGNSITAAGAIRVQCPSSKAFVQVQLATFPASGTYVTPAYNLGYAPKTGRTVKNNIDANAGLHVNADKPTGSTVTASLVLASDGTTAYTPNGTLKDIKVKLVLTGGAVTPWLFGVNGYIEGARAMRQGTPRPTTYNSARMTDGMALDMSPMAADADPLSWIAQNRCGQGCIITDANDNELMMGLLGTPTAEGGQSPNITQEVNPMWSQMEQARFITDWRLDGMTDASAITKCMRFAGIADNRMNIGTGVALPFDPRGLVTVWKVKAGTSAGDVAREIVELWSNRKLEMRDVSGVQKFSFADEASPSSVFTFKKSYLNGGHKDAYWELKLSRGRRDADKSQWNGVLVRGWDVQGAVEYTSLLDEATAQNPTLALADRPEGWFGGPVRMVVQDNRLCSQAACAHACQILKDRYCAIIDKASWVADRRDNVFVGSCVTIEDHGVYRITSINALENEAEYDAGSHACQYVTYNGEKV